jgi:Glycosidases
MLGATLHMMQGTPYVYEGEELGMTNVHYTELSQYQDIQTLNAYQEYVEIEKIVDAQTMLRYLAYRSRDNARTPMPWNAQDNGDFTNAKPWLALNPNYKTINVEASLQDPDSVFYFYQQLIKLRHQYDVIVYGDCCVVDLEDEDVFTYLRHYKGQTLLVISNFTDKRLLGTMTSMKGDYS